MNTTNPPAAATAKARLTTDQALRSIRVREVADLLGVSVPTVWRWALRPDFPPAIRLSSRVTCWNVGEVVSWRDAQTSVCHKVSRQVGVRA